MTVESDESAVAFAQRSARRLTRVAREFRRIARRCERLEPVAPVTRIYGEPVVGDLGEDVFARAGLRMARVRVADAAEYLAEDLRAVVG